MKDGFGRSIEYLRISVTDRCNFRCVYCMPERGLDWIPRDDILSAAEIHAVVAQLAPLGLCRIRITGGEPTLRRDLKLDPIRVIHAALDAGFEPVKINTVVVRGVNDDEIASLARLTGELPVHIRFIELMPVGDMSDSGFEHVVPSEQVLATARDALGALVPDVGPTLGNGPARYYPLRAQPERSA